jgi:Ca-activated chloride channel family protein
MKDDYGIIKQIIIITDGRSNIGGDPEKAAALAKEKGIIISGIGIIDNSGEDENDIKEVEAIARAGGGIADFCYIENLGKTLQVLTQKTVNNTLECIVNKQLKSIAGIDISNVEPESRIRLVDFIEKYGDRVSLKCCIVLDTSKSMTYKLDMAKRCIKDLLNTLNCRQGEIKLSIITYPGTGYDICSVICPFTNDSLELEESLKSVKARGGTPTGPAIDMAARYISQEDVSLNVEEARCDAGSHYV